MNDLLSTLFWVRVVKLLIEIALFALIGQGVMSVLARLFGQAPEANMVYRLFATVTSPVTKPCRWITPKFIADRFLPVVAFSLLAVGYVCTLFVIANACIGAGLPIAQCLQAR
ncbi:MAG: YggT family protein [Casimicrobiaceae bacterium]